MKNSKKAFTMIELIFVIIIIGILASIASSKLGGMKDTANIANARSDLAAIRSAIFTERQRSLVQGFATYIPKLSADFATTPTLLFNGNGARTLLSYGLKAGTGAGEWSINSDTHYQYNSGIQATDFDYNSTTGIFNCTVDTNDCNALAN